MNSDMESEKECANAVRRQDRLLNVVERIVALRTIVERVDPPESRKKDLQAVNMSLAEPENGQLSIRLEEDKCSDQGPSKREIIETGLPESEKECFNAVRRQDGLLDIVERVGPPESEKNDLPPINGSLVESENDQLSVSESCSGEVKLIRSDQANILNFAETAFLANQVPPMCGMIKTGQSTKLPIIQEECQDGVKEKKLPAMKIAEQLANFDQFGFYEDDVYLFKNSNYKLCRNEDLEELIYSVLKRSDITPPGYKFLQDVRNFLKLEAKSKKFTEADVEQVRRYIGFKNGLLQLDTMKFIAPNPAIFIRNYLDIDYDPQLLENVSIRDLKKINCPNFDRFITIMSEGNPLIFDRIYEMIGYIVSNDCAAKKLFVLSGPSNSGKSKLGAFIMGLFNKEAVIAIPLGVLGERFSLGKLPGKALCVDLDLPATRINSRTAAIIKSLTGGDATSAEDKYESRKTFTNRAKMLYATNHMIEISESEHVLRDRFIGIPIRRTIPKENQCTDLLDYFEAEKFPIVMKSIGYYRELVKNHYEFSGKFDLNEAVIDDSFSRVMTPEYMINKFVDEKCIFTDYDKYTHTDRLYQAFRDYYGTEAHSIDYRYFSRLLQSLYPDRVDKDKKRRDGSTSPLSVFKGIIIKEE